MARALVLDCETTGREPPEVRTMAAVVVDDELLIDDPQIFMQGYSTEKPSTATARSVHKLPELVCGRPAAKAWEDLIAWTRDSGGQEFEYIIAHNVDYDWGALGKPDVKRICTLALSRSLYDDDEGHSLGAMIMRICPHEEAVSRLSRYHAADVDVDNCLLLARHLRDRLGVRTLEDLYEASEAARIPKRITFGKHKGTLVSELPADYCRWYMAQADTDPYLVRAMEDRLLAGRKPAGAR